MTSTIFIIALVVVFLVACGVLYWGVIKFIQGDGSE